MNTSRKAMEWLFCFSIMNLMLGCLLFKKIKQNIRNSENIGHIALGTVR